MKWIKQNWFLLVAVLFLFGTVGKWPYAYYQLLRWVVCGVAIYSAYNSYESKRNGWTWIFGIIAVLFNPIMPFYLQKETWLILDIATAFVLLILLFSSKKKLDRNGEPSTIFINSVL